MKGSCHNTIDDAILDAVIGRTYDFTVGDKRFTLYPQSLGVSLITARLISMLHISPQLLKREPGLEIVRVTKLYRDIVCKIVAYSTFTKKEDILNTALVQERTKELSEAMDDNDLSQLLLIILSADRMGEFMEYLSIERDKREREKVYKAKDNKNSVTFGGKSIFGSLLDAACERYGWSVDYVVWGVSYVCLRLMLADMVTSVYLTEEERKKAHINTDGVVMSADDPKNWERINNLKFD